MRGPHLGSSRTQGTPLFSGETQLPAATACQVCQLLPSGSSLLLMALLLPCPQGFVQVAPSMIKVLCQGQHLPASLLQDVHDAKPLIVIRPDLSALGCSPSALPEMELRPLGCPHLSCCSISAHLCVLGMLWGSVLSSCYSLSSLKVSPFVGCQISNLYL